MFLIWRCNIFWKFLTFRRQVNHHGCKNLKTSREVKDFLFHLGALISNSVRIRLCHLEKKLRYFFKKKISLRHDLKNFLRYVSKFFVFIMHVKEFWVMFAKTKLQWVSKKICLRDVLRKFLHDVLRKFSGDVVMF